MSYPFIITFPFPLLILSLLSTLPLFLYIPSSWKRHSSPLVFVRLVVTQRRRKNPLKVIMKTKERKKQKRKKTARR